MVVGRPHLGAVVDGAVVDGAVVVGAVVAVEEGCVVDVAEEALATDSEDADGGLGKLVPFGTNPMVISWPFCSRRFEGSPVTVVPAVAARLLQVFTCTSPLEEPQLWPFLYSGFPGYRTEVALSSIPGYEDTKAPRVALLPVSLALVGWMWINPSPWVVKPVLRDADEGRFGWIDPHMSNANAAFQWSLVVGAAWVTGWVLS